MPGSEQDAASATLLPGPPVEDMRHHRGEFLSKREERLTPVVGTCKELANVVPSEVSQGDR